MNKINKFLFVTMFVAMSVSCIAQTTITTAGGNAKHSRGSVSYTVGQTASKNVVSRENKLNEGVQQIYSIREIAGLSGIESDRVELSAVVFPNPTDNLLRLQLNNYQIPAAGLEANLYDNRGKLLQRNLVTEELSEFQIGQYAAGYYILELKYKNEVLKSFNISRKGK